MNAVMQCILERRTIRKYQSEQILQEELVAILQAGLYAPSAGGGQSPFFVVSQNHEVNEMLGKINRAYFAAKVAPGGFHVSDQQPSIADDSAIESAFYGAPTVTTVFGRKGSSYSVIDCAVAAENMMLAAYSLGIGSCLVARAPETFASDYGRQLLELWNIPENYEPILHVTLGYPASQQPQAKPRKENRIKFVG